MAKSKQLTQIQTVVREMLRHILDDVLQPDGLENGVLELSAGQKRYLDFLVGVWKASIDNQNADEMAPEVKKTMEALPDEDIESFLRSKSVEVAEGSDIPKNWIH